MTGEQERAAEAQGGEALQDQTVRELLLLVVKALKALRLYQGKNAVAERLQDELFSRLTSHLDQEGQLRLTVKEFQISHGEAVVYESRDHTDSLAFLLFRDGIRRLGFLPGIEKAELGGLLESLSRVSAAGNEQHDIVTLFWEQDFGSIRYFAVDALATEPEGPRLERQLASGWTEAAGGEGARAAAVSLDGLAQPVLHFPIADCQLSDEETDSLRAELSRQDEEAFWVKVVELAIDLALLETSEPEREKLAQSLVEIMARLLADGEVDAVAGSVEHLCGLAELVFHDSEPVQRLELQLVGSLALAKPVDRFLECVESSRAVKPADLSAYLRRLGPMATGSLIPWMGRLPTAPLRRAVSEALLAAGEAATHELVRHLLAAEGATTETLLREGLFVLGQLPTAQALRAVESLMASTWQPTRREVARLLGRFREQRVYEICLRLLDDDDQEVRACALDIIVRHGPQALARQILDSSLGSGGFAERDLAEKRRTFAAVGKLGGEKALDWFTELLSHEARRWFVSRHDRDLREAVAHGIRAVGTEKAWQLLRDVAEGGERVARAACLKELEADKGA